jgi:hypothetical protein
MQSRAGIGKRKGQRENKEYLLEEGLEMAEWRKIEC